MAKDKGKTEKVLVGTYRPENEAWIRERRLYNLPLPRVIGHKEHKDRKDGRARCPQRAEAGDAALSFGDLGDCPRSWRFDRKGGRVGTWKLREGWFSIAAIETTTYFSVTNQLLSSGRPLVQLDIGEGGD